MCSIQELKKLIVLSIKQTPAKNLTELMERDFLHNRAKSGIDRLLCDLIREKHLYEKNNKIYASKKSKYLLD